MDISMHIIFLNDSLMNQFNWNTKLVYSVIISSCHFAGERLHDFTIHVGGVGDTTPTFDASNYQVCAKLCSQQTSRKRVYSCKRELIGQRVAVQINMIGFLTLCEVEVYGESIEGKMQGCF